MCPFLLTGARGGCDLPRALSRSAGTDYPVWPQGGPHQPPFGPGAGLNLRGRGCRPCWSWRVCVLSWGLIVLAVGILALLAQIQHGCTLFGGWGESLLLPYCHPSLLPFPDKGFESSIKINLDCCRGNEIPILYQVFNPLLKKGLICANSCGNCKWRATLDAE